MNPFVRSSAGIFAATGSAHETTIAERICAALSVVIKDKYDKILDPEWWTECVNQIPNQTPAKAEDWTAPAISGETDAVQLAKACVSPPSSAIR